MIIKNIVFSGGNLKGLSFFGGLKFLKEHNLLTHLKHVAGTSVGSIVAFCFILDYDIQDLEKLFIKLELENYNNITTDTIFSFFDNYGIDSGDKLFTVFKVLLKKKGFEESITLREFYEKTKIELTLVGCCVNTSKPIYFNYKKYPNQSLLTCLRISYCIPLIYTPIKIDDMYYVDGGLIDNYCIQLFDEEIKYTLGFVVNNPNDHSNKIDTFESYIKSILTKFINTNFNKLIKYIDNTVYILSSISASDWKLTEDEKKELIENGYVTTQLFIKSKK